MENPGLVTFRDVLLLLDPRHATTSMRRAQASVIAHEFAHQWFGDLVTMRWWDDLWLNEGFATWAEAKIVDAWRPSFGATLEEIAGTQGVMDTDALDSARAVREPVRTTSEVQEAFDGITYDKGAAVLRMLESWLGPETFRRGVQKYIHDNAWKNARADDLLQGLDFVSTQPVGDLANELPRTNRRPVGAGQLDVRGPRRRQDRAARESEWRPLGDARPGGPRAWTSRCASRPTPKKTPAASRSARSRSPRALGGGCPAWVYPNAERGGLLPLPPRPDPAARAGARRAGSAAGGPAGPRVECVGGVRQGALEPGALLDVLPSFDSETSH